MNRFVRLFSLALAILMMFSMATVQMFAAEEDGTKTYSVNGYKTATPDGEISADEYSVKAELSVSGHANEVNLNGWTTSINPGKDSEEVSLNFAHDENKIYIGIYDKSGARMIREGYGIRLGFDEEHPENFVALWFQCMNLVADGTATKTPVHDALQMSSFTVSTSDYPYYQAGFRGIYRSNGNKFWYLNVTGDWDGTTVMKYDEATKSTYPVTAMMVVKEAVRGNVTASGTGHGRIKGQHYTYTEIELDKKLLLDYVNEMYEGAGLENLDTMLFQFVQAETESGNMVAPYTVWGGSFDANVAEVESPIDVYNFDKVVFSKEAETLPPETEAPTAAPETDAPTAAPETDAPIAGNDQTEAPVTDAPAEGGCGAAVSLVGMALVATLGACTAFVAKKKED